MWLTRHAFSQALPGADFRASSCAALVASVFRGVHRYNAQSTRVTGQACRKRPIHAGYRSGMPETPNPRGLQGMLLRQGPSFAERWGVLQLGAAFVNSPPPCARYIPPPRMPHASLHTPFIFPSRGAGRLRLSIAAGLPLGPRQRAAPSPVATDLTSIHPSVRRIRCATRSSRNAPCCSSSACC